MRSQKVRLEPPQRR